MEQVRTLLATIDTSHVVGLRDCAAIALLIYTAARVGAVAKLRLCDFQHNGMQHVLRCSEKRGRVREIPVRHDLSLFILEYLDAAGIHDEPKDSSLLRSGLGKTKRLTNRPMTRGYLYVMLKGRLKTAPLPTRL